MPNGFYSYYLRAEGGRDSCHEEYSNGTYNLNGDKIELSEGKVI